MTPLNLSLKKISDIVGGSLKGDASTLISNITPIEDATSGDLSFVMEDKFLNKAKGTKASALVTFKSTGFENEIIVKNTRNALQLLLAFITKNNEASNSFTISDTAIISKKATLSPQVNIGHFVSIGNHSTIAEKTIIKHNVTIGNNVTIGKKCILYPSVVIYDNVTIGDNVILHAGAKIGVDGFGYVQVGSKWKKIPHIGTVIIEHDVEVGANCCVDRGCLGKTLIKSGTKVDNLSHVAHNVNIGSDTAIAGLVGIAGSAIIGNNVQIAGQVGIASVTVGNNCIIGGQAGVLKSLNPNEMVVGTPATPIKEEYKIRAYLKILYKNAVKGRQKK
ncbi:UDP-3-O-(3-hydroxymyristoyl)glucosamine N-acyltransferase [bacterium]|jgi:UDP-3-O-[3-hydroxymyristoyl] glucosamine N-acyltransferase|nr:UDP-3-O-(3-hydroxymyristoyl)glucosamine N-acyltransferase [bacterium]